MSVAIASAMSSKHDTAAAVQDVLADLDSLGSPPSFLFVFYTAEYDDRLIHRLVTEKYPDVPLIGGSSESGVMAHTGLGDPRSLGILVISDPDGDYGVAAAEFDGDAAAIAESTLHAALAAAGAAGELPELIWLYQAPGREEEVLAGLRRIVGDRCPIIGGTAAVGLDDTPWREMTRAGVMGDGLALAVLFPSGGLGVSYQGGFEPTGLSGVVTKLGPAEAASSAAELPSRHVLEIDGEPAADVYNRWTEQKFDQDVIRNGGALSPESAWTPLGIAAGTAGHMEYYRLSHVHSVSPQRGLRILAGVHEGVRVYGMRGNKRSLIHRAGRVVTTAMRDIRDHNGDVAGGLMIYCLGCRIAVGDDVDRVAAAARSGFGSAPFLGCFTAGEQGPALGENVHSNMMISAVVFGR